MKCNTSANVRFTNKLSNQNERLLFQSYWSELTNMYGVYADYFMDLYSLSAHDFFYGEHPTAPYKEPTGIILLAEFNNDSMLLAKFGIQTDADATFIIPIKSFREVFGATAEPKSGDLVRMTEFGWDRPGGIGDIATPATDGSVGSYTINCSLSSSQTYSNSAYSNYDNLEEFQTLLRGAPVYEITERRDQIMGQQYNNLQGHYVWILHAKQYDYNYRPNAPRTPGQDQISDETEYGKLSGGTIWSENEKLYSDNTEEDARKIWNYSKSPDSNDSVYGEY